MSSGAETAAAADHVLEFFFDIGSPYSYMASARIDALQERTGVTVRWRPFLLGGLFKAIGHPIGVSDRRGRYTDADLKRWSQHLDVPYLTPSVFPVNTILAQRALVAADRSAPEKMPDLAHGLYKAFYVDDRDITMPEVVGDVADRVGFPSEKLLPMTQDPEVKAGLRATTEEAVTRGAFGAPTFFWGDQLFWGQDRIMFVELAIRETMGAPAG